jgi:hypothetical protein
MEDCAILPLAQGRGTELGLLCFQGLGWGGAGHGVAGSTFLSIRNLQKSHLKPLITHNNAISLPCHGDA